MKHQTQVTINLRAYKNNVRVFRNLLPARTRLCAVVKADAYGHGLEAIAPAAIEAGADVLGFVDNWEAECIRALGIEAPILRLRPCLGDEADEAIAWDVHEIVGSFESAELLSALGRRTGRRIPIHLKVDVGISRAGFSLPSQRDEIERSASLPGLRVVGVMTHFPCADDENSEITLTQLADFNQILESLKDHLPDECVLHAANSAAITRFPAAALDMARVGIFLYGLRASPDMPMPRGVEPVMSWTTRVALVREVPAGATVGYGMTHRMSESGRIATLPLGYADGYLRSYSNQTSVLIRGNRCPVIGRVSMNMITVDVGHVADIQAGDEVVLLGSQADERIEAHELARYADSIDYEIVSLVGKTNSDWRFFVT